MNSSPVTDNVSPVKWVTGKLFGAPKNLDDPKIFHKLALIPFFAWIGLGADGLSSSAYGPEEAFRALQGHTYLAIFLALATALTVIIISYAYSKIIEHFPYGGGGYIVATKMLGEKAGVISGSALLVDYILTVTVSIASCSDAIFSYMPVSYAKYKILFATVLILLLIVLNIRGIKESIYILAPIFVIFVLTHIFMLVYGISVNAWELKPVVHQVQTGLTKDLSTLGMWGVLLLFVRAYSLGGGTYTGIEAVSNGLQIMREPKVKTGKRTMFYMASSLSLAAGGLFLCYLLANIHPTSGKTLNAVLADNLFGGWRYGPVLAFITIFSEGALLFVAAQAGFIDAPRVMANMALDNWLPRRFTAYSERITMRNGIMLIGAASLILLWYTNGSISALIVMYSINVFLTFSISEFGMVLFYFKQRKTQKDWKKHILIYVVALLLCGTILVVTVFEKFMEGGWLTLLITSAFIITSMLIRKHYNGIHEKLKKIEEVLTLPADLGENLIQHPTIKGKTAVQMVSGYNGLGMHTFYSMLRAFPNIYSKIVFVSVGVVDQGLFKGESGIEKLKENITDALEKYKTLAHRFGLEAEVRMEISTDLIETAAKICVQLSDEIKNITVFTGKLAFKEEKFIHGILHNETAFSLQRKLQPHGIMTIILPITI